MFAHQIHRARGSTQEGQLAGGAAQEHRGTLRADGGSFEIPRIDLSLVVDVPDLDQEAFDEHSSRAKAVYCPVSNALAGPTITLDATLGP